MNKFLTMIGIGILLSPAASAENIHARERRQQGRILEGVRTGSLTRGEANSLFRREAALRREVYRDRNDGHGLTRGERLKIDRQQDALDRSIYRQKHDWQNWR